MAAMTPSWTVGNDSGSARRAVRTGGGEAGVGSWHRGRLGDGAGAEQQRSGHRRSTDCAHGRAA
ncbi:hypothetical protein AWC17_23280 [Mycobacterium nebraskense]|uniref:Uncharacterized protein n=1 Tax=Mycobacterium nebraskense TaxID=244292 RepID=A0A1X2A1B8_9MYCO|nr:hypothetical protein ABW17_17000 [Mycobacterium nebraskense]ORW34888.1 hypothetical protein AWC17_23280 [Mycobacterium nebraskense]